MRPGEERGAPRELQPLEMQLRAAAAARGVGVYVNDHAKRAQRPHVILTVAGPMSNVRLGLGEFRTFGAALQWLTAGARTA